MKERKKKEQLIKKVKENLKTTSRKGHIVLQYCNLFKFLPWKCIEFCYNRCTKWRNSMRGEMIYFAFIKIDNKSLNLKESLEKNPAVLE